MRAFAAGRRCVGGLQGSLEEGSVARRSAVCLVLVTALVALCAPAAFASGSLLGLNNDCGSTSQPFAQFGDDRYYTFGSNGGLESGSTGGVPGGGKVGRGEEALFWHSLSRSR